MVRNTRALKALISTEFIFVFPIALTVVLAIMGFGFTGYQRARIDYSLAHLADRLPAGWDPMNADTLVTELEHLCRRGPRLPHGEKRLCDTRFR